MSKQRNLISSLIEPDYRTKGWRDSALAPRKRGGRGHALTGLSALLLILLGVLLYADDPGRARELLNNPAHWLPLALIGFAAWIGIGLILRSIVWLLIRPREPRAPLVSAARRRARNFRQGAWVISLVGIGLGLTLYHTHATRPLFAFLDPLSDLQAMIVPGGLGMLALLVPFLAGSLLVTLARSQPHPARPLDDNEARPGGADSGLTRRAPDPLTREQQPAPTTPSAARITPPADEVAMQLEVRKRALRLHHDAVNPGDFEHEVAWLINVLTDNKAVVVGGAGDGGIDVKVYDRKGRLTGIVQCKRYNPEVVLPPGYVRELHSVKTQHKVKSATLVTTARFSDQTRKEARSLGIDLIDGQKLIHLRQKARSRLKA